MACDRVSLAGALVVALVLPLAVAGCGRKGPLDPPPSAALPQPAPSAPARTTYVDPTTPTGGAQPAAVQTTQAAPPPPKKTFPLDFLIQ